MGIPGNEVTNLFSLAMIIARKVSKVGHNIKWAVWWIVAVCFTTKSDLSVIVRTMNILYLAKQCQVMVDVIIPH